VAVSGRWGAGHAAVRGGWRLRVNRGGAGPRQTRLQCHPRQDRTRIQGPDLAGGGTPGGNQMASRDAAEEVGMSTAPRIDAGDLGLPQVRSQRKRTLLKRTVDIVLGSLGLLLALPVIACLVVVIRLDSPGPALFGQRRLGRLGRPFTFCKLRSIYQHTIQPFPLQPPQAWLQATGSCGR